MPGVAAEARIPACRREELPRCGFARGIVGGGGGLTRSSGQAKPVAEASSKDVPPRDSGPSVGLTRPRRASPLPPWGGTAGMWPVGAKPVVNLMWCLQRTRTNSVALDTCDWFLMGRPSYPGAVSTMGSASLLNGCTVHAFAIRVDNTVMLNWAGQGWPETGGLMPGRLSRRSPNRRRGASPSPSSGRRGAAHAITGRAPDCALTWPHQDIPGLRRQAGNSVLAPYRLPVDMLSHYCLVADTMYQSFSKRD